MLNNGAVIFAAVMLFQMSGTGAAMCLSVCRRTAYPRLCSFRSRPPGAYFMQARTLCSTTSYGRSLASRHRPMPSFYSVHNAQQKCFLSLGAAVVSPNTAEVL